MFIAATGVPEPEARLIMIKKVLSFLPPTNHRLLKILCNFLKKLVEKKDINKMSSENVAICFAPNLLRADTNDLKLLLKNQSMGKDLMISLIDKYDYFFSQDIVYKEEKIKKYKDVKDAIQEKELTPEEKFEEKRRKLLKKSQTLIHNIDMQSIITDDIKKYDQSLSELDQLVDEKPLIHLPKEENEKSLTKKISENSLPTPPKKNLEKRLSNRTLPTIPLPPEKGPEKKKSPNQTILSNEIAPTKLPPLPPKLPDLPTPPSAPKPKLSSSPGDIKKEIPSPKTEISKRKPTVLPDIPQKKM